MTKFFSRNNKVIKLIKNLLPSWIINLKRNYINEYSSKSYSQEGEDMILRRIFENRNNGFYVDVGAHHPRRFSNTYYFYNLGWKGINIDAMPSSMIIFNKMRPRDINLEFPISAKQETLTYYAFNDPALNGFSNILSSSREKLKNYKIIFQQQMMTTTLEVVLDEYLPRGQLIDFLSIDVEGYDYSVLLSNNWNKYSPNVVLVEILDVRLDDVITSEIAKYMNSKGYVVFAKTLYTVFFRLDKI
jgi:hypothetical protein